MESQPQTTTPAAYGLFVSECEKHGISRATAYRLADDDLLDTFKIGRRRYVMLESLRSLPRRLAERDQKAVA